MSVKLLPNEKIARQLVNLSVPIYQQTELVGVHYKDIITNEQLEKQTALWKLALLYNSIANSERKYFSELKDVYLSALKLGVSYFPPSIVIKKIKKYSNWLQSDCKYLDEIYKFEQNKNNN